MKTLRMTAIVALVICLAAAGALAQESVTGPHAPGMLKMPGTSMWIPWTDFQKILEKFSVEGPKPPEPPPVDAVISSARYTADVNGSGVEVTVKADVFVLKQQGWASVPVMRVGVPLSEAALDGRPTALVAGNSGLLELLVQEFGAHSLTLKLQLPVTKNSGPDQFALPAVRAQVNRLAVNLDRPNLDVRISPGGHMESRTDGPSTEATGSFPPSDRVTVSWTQRVPKSVKETARVSAEVRTMLTLGEGIGVYTAIVDYDIHHKPISTFSMLLPQDVTVADVSTEGLVDWKTRKRKNGQELIVSISFEAVGRHPVAVTYEKMLPPGDKVTLPTSELVVQDVVREMGYLAVAVRTNVQVDPKEGSLENLAQIDPSELPPDLRGYGDQKVLYGFKYIKHPSRLELEVIRHKDASVLTCEVEHARYRIMLTDRGKQLIDATYRIANRSLQYLTLTLPEGADLWGVYRDGEPIKAAEADGRILLPIFKGGLHETFTMQILAYRDAGSWLPLGSRQIELPTLDVGANKVVLELYLPQRFHFFGFGGKLRRGSGVVTATGILPTGSEAPISGPIGNEKAKGDSYYDMDKKSIEWNLRYRSEQSKVQKQIVNIPVTAENRDYINAMSRGALPVQFEVTWEGRPYNFATSIVDPDEKTSVTFWYNRRTRSATLWWLILLLSAFLGFLIARSVASRRCEHAQKPSSVHILLAVAAIILLAVFTMMRGGATFTIVLGLIIGALVLLLHLRREKKSTPSETPPDQGQSDKADEADSTGGGS